MHYSLRSLLIGLLVFGGATGALAQQNVGIGTTTPHAKAALEIAATDKGLLIPRMDSASRAAIGTPPDGLLVFQTDGRQGFWYAVGGSWLYLPNKTVSGDNLGSHSATQNLNLNAKALVGTGANLGTAVGLGVTSWGGLNLGQNTTGNNVYAGYDAGLSNTTGIRNLFVGFLAGRVNSTGNDNTLLGYRAGKVTATGSDNVFVGSEAGGLNTAGSANVYLGSGSGLNSTSSRNTFVGSNSGSVNTSGANNWAFGYNAGPGVNGLTNAGAIGYQAVVMQSNSLVLGGIGADAVKVGIGTPVPAATLHVAGAASTVQLEGLTGTGTRVVTADASGNLGTTTTAALADNLGNHTATQNLNLNGFKLTGGGTTGLRVGSTGAVTSESFISMNDKDIYFRGTNAGDTNHGVGWYGGGATWAGFNVDGPVLYGFAAGVLGTRSGGARSVLTWNSSGNVGIGTTAPGTVLDVAGSFRTSGGSGTYRTYNFPLGASPATTLMAEYRGTTGYGPLVRYVGAGAGTDFVDIGQNRNGDFLVQNSGGGFLTMSQAGNVGINTETAAAKLDVQGGADATGANDPYALAFSYRAGGFRHWVRTRHNANVTQSGNAVDFFVNNASTGGGSAAPTTGTLHVLTLDNNNGQPRVGIGTTNPTATLEVTGASSTVKLGGLAGTGTRMVTADASGNLSTQAVPVDTDAQQLTKTGSTISLTDGGSVTDADNQNLSLSGAALSISGGTGITLPDASATNELQTISKTGNTVTLSNGGGSFTDADTDAQTLSVSGGNLSISGGNSVALTSLDAQQLTKTGSTISLTNGGSVTDADNQNLSLSGGNLSISGGTGIALPDASASNELQTISKTGSTVTLSNGGGAFTDADNQTLSISGSTISLTNGGSVTVPSSADNLGNHTATQNLNLGNHTLIGNGGTTGLQISGNGRLLTTADNLVAGKNAGNASLSGINNTLLGAQSGYSLAGGSANTLTGVNTGNMLTSGGENTFAGFTAGFNTTTGGTNVAVGYYSGYNNVTGTGNTLLGAGADVASGALTNATAVGSNAQVSQSNSLVLGGTGASAVNVGIGTPAPAATLHVAGSTSTVRLEGLAGTGTRMLTADAGGNLSSAVIPVDTDAQQLTKTGLTISLTNGGSVTDADNQSLSLSGAALNISGGTGITLPDASATNELQTISKTGSTVTLSNGGGSFTDADTDAQTLSISGSTISLTNGGSVTVPSSADNLGNHTAAQNLQLGNYRLLGGGSTTNGFAINNNGYINTVSLQDNVILGAAGSGNAITTGAANVVVGMLAGRLMTSGTNNTLLGTQAGYAITTGNDNTLVGMNSGTVLTTSAYNTALGTATLQSNTTGSENVAVGHSAGATNVTGTKLTLLGRSADVTVDGLTNATAIGQQARVSQSNSLVLGGTGGNAVKVGIGTTAPTTQLDVVGGGALDGGGTFDGTFTAGGNALRFGNSSSGEGIGSKRTTGNGQFGLTFYTAFNARMTVANNGNVGIGTLTPGVPLDVQTSSNLTYSSYGYLNSGGSTGLFSGSSTNAVAIRATGRVIAPEFNATSDRRLKNVLGLTDNAADLALLQRLRITDYTMRDRAQYGDRRFKKVIAQEVETVFPQAVQQHAGFLPDIYASAATVATTADSLLTLTVGQDLPAAQPGQRVKLVGAAGEAVGRVVRATGRSLTVAGVSGLGPEVFVFGLEHPDVRTVDYEALAMLNVSATQALARQVAALQQARADDRTETERLRQQLNGQQAALQTLQAQLARLLGEAPAGAEARK